jgi:predicted nucleotidyltransferase
MSVYSIEQIRERVAPVARGHGVKRVMLFGSYARGEATESSDVDLHVWCKHSLKSLWDLGGFYADLEDALEKKVDIVTHESIRKRFYERIKSDEVLLYGEVYPGPRNSQTHSEVL